MKLPRDLSGSSLARVLCRDLVHQVGSHIILETESPRHHRLAVPDHSPRRLGTLDAILRAVANAKGVGKVDMLEPL